MRLHISNYTCFIEESGRLRLTISLCSSRFLEFLGAGWSVSASQRRRAAFMPAVKLYLQVQVALLFFAGRLLPLLFSRVHFNLRIQVLLVRILNIDTNHILHRATGLIVWIMSLILISFIVVEGDSGDWRLWSPLRHRLPLIIAHRIILIGSCIGPSTVLLP